MSQIAIDPEEDDEAQSAAKRVTARYYALNFVLAHGEAISDDAGQLTNAFTESLIAFEDIFLPVWHTMKPADRFQVAYFDVSMEILQDDFPAFNHRLAPHERFEWRIKICRLLLMYLTERSRLSMGDLDPLLDYYFLVHDAIRALIDNRGCLLNIDTWEWSNESIEIDIHHN